ncbi:partial Tyrosine recombinase XerC, partial [Patescibacteria group bacterium]
MNTQALQQQSAFVDYLKIEKRASIYTLESYQHDLQQLLHYCQTKKIEHWQNLQTQDIRAYIANRHRQGLSAKSLQRELSAIRSFYRYLLKNQFVDTNPALYIKAPKAARKLPKVLDVDQVSGLLDAGTSSLLEIRDVAMFELFYSSGLRLAELAALNLQDLDFADKSLIVRSGKGGKTRLLPIGSKAITALQNWLAQRNNMAAPSETAVFTAKHGKRLGRRSIEMRLEQWCLKKGVNEKVHPHILRHCF